MAKEKIKIIKFIEEISNKNYAKAHKYLKSVIEDKITKKINKRNRKTTLLNMKKSEALPKQAAEVLTEDSVKEIETAIEEKIQLSVEAALTNQDELYAEKLEELVTAIDKDHTSKLKRVVEAVDH